MAGESACAPATSVSCNLSLCKLPSSDLHECAWSLCTCVAPLHLFFFPKGKVSCSFSNSSWYRVNCNQLAGGLVQSKHLERGDCTSRYPGAVLAAWPPLFLLLSLSSLCLLHAFLLRSSQIVSYAALYMRRSVSWDWFSASLRRPRPLWSGQDHSLGPARPGLFDVQYMSAIV